MSVASAHTTREAKEKWLIRPINWASNVAFFSFFFGVFFWFEGKIDTAILSAALVIAMGIASVLLFWAHVRIMNAARGRG